MNLKLTAAVAAIIGFGAAQGAVAADLPARPVYKAPVMAPVYNWSGIYIGGHIGGGWSNVDVGDPTGFFGGGVGADSSGFIGGGQIGANWQWSNLVLGLQADISATDLSDTSSLALFPTTSASYKTDWVSTLTGRIGYAQNNWLAYFKGGAAWAHNKYSVVDPTISWNFSGKDTETGWTIGGGLEYGFAPNWSGFIEYDFIDLGTRNVTVVDPVNGAATASVKQDIQMVKAGINYRFSTVGGPAGWR
ncbi:MAG TPA: outer membrane beta-barrel protein [Xanthobacteraceae bacterium]|nr:outer membrane beta-barrel protein [Xanthobacteraceae bacterium]